MIYIQTPLLDPTGVEAMLDGAKRIWFLGYICNGTIASCQNIEDHSFFQVDAERVEPTEGSYEPKIDDSINY